MIPLEESETWVRRHDLARYDVSCAGYPPDLTTESISVAFTCTVPARPTVQVDDDRVRITRWDFEPGANTGWHEHGRPYCVVMVLGGTLAIHNGETVSHVTLASGDAYVRPKGITHDVMNASDHPVAFVEVEMKR